MSIKTIHCRLTAPEPIRRHLWHLMSEGNTPLINELLTVVSQHPEFENWQRRGTIPIKTVKDLCKPLRAKYPGQPGRFYDSACLMVSYTYESWLALQQKRRRQLDGKQRWLDIIKSDADLIKLSGTTLKAIKQQALGILSQLNPIEHQSDPKKGGQGKKRQRSSSSSNTDLMSRLFEAYAATNSIVEQCAIAYLIKTGGKIYETEEDPEKFAHRIHRKQKEIDRLEKQLEARLPKGRDVTDEKFQETLELAVQSIPESVTQQREWEAKLSARRASLPYPIIYGSSVDIRWGKTTTNRLTVSFSGIDKYLKTADPAIQEWLKTVKEHAFRLYCDQRQLPFFQRFFNDWQAYQEQTETYPAGLLTLSSAILAWRKGTGKGNPWDTNHLVLYCSFDTRLMTAEGTLQVQQEKLAKAEKSLPSAETEQEFTEAQQKFHQRSISTLSRLRNVPPRPSRKLYEGNPEILIGLSLGLSEPITVAVVNGRTGEVLTYRTAQTLLGKQYRLFNRHRQQQQQNALKRHKNQARGVKEQPSESTLGEYVDRLLAKSIVELAQTYKAASIIIPNLTNLRELLASEINARAEQACPGIIQAQHQYTKQYQQRIHRWSYSRLLEATRSKAAQLGISIETGFQPKSSSSKEQARDLAIAAYHLRAIATT